MKTKFELGEEVYVKGKITGIGLNRSYTDDKVVYAVEIYEGNKNKILEVEDWQLERRVQQ